MQINERRHYTGMHPKQACRTGVVTSVDEYGWGILKLDEPYLLGRAGLVTDIRIHDDLSLLVNDTDDGELDAPL